MKRPHLHLQPHLRPILTLGPPKATNSPWLGTAPCSSPDLQAIHGVIPGEVDLNLKELQVTLIPTVNPFNRIIILTLLMAINNNLKCSLNLNSLTRLQIPTCGRLVNILNCVTF